MSYPNNEQNYLKLISQFLEFEMDAGSFCQKWLSLWKIDRDEQYSQVNPSSERYALRLQEALNCNEITGEEFERKWVELWGYGEYKHLLEMVDCIFTACDVFNPEPENKYEIDEEDLRKEVKSHLDTYQTVKLNLHQ